MTPSLEQQSILIVFLGLAGILGAVTGVSTVIKNIALTRAARDPARMPPLAEEIAKIYATKSELRKFEDDMKTSCRANHQQVDKVHGDLFSLVRKTQGDIITRLDILSREVGEWQRGIERQIGKLEGRIDT